MESTFIENLVSLGFQGIVILGLGYTCLKLWAKYDDIQEKRIAEARETTKAIEQNTGALETLTEVLKNRTT